MTAARYGRCAIGSYAYYRYSPDYFLNAAASLGFDKVELWAVAPQIDLICLMEADCKVWAKRLAERSLSVTAVTPEQLSYPINIASDSKILRRRSIGYYQNGIEFAAAVQSPYLILTAGSGYYDEPVSFAWERSLDSLGQLALFAKERGVKLLLETLTPASSNLINSPEQVRQMIDLLPQNTVFGMLDIGQMAVMGQTVAQYGQALGDKLRYVHLHDTGDACHMALGDGKLDLNAILTRLERWGYEGLFGLECNDARYRSCPFETDQKNARWLKEKGFL